MKKQQKLDCCFVTGSNGFLGGYLLEKLQQNKINTRTLLRSPSNHPVTNNQVVVGGLSPNSIGEDWLEGIDTVFHLAGTAHLSASPEQYQRDYLITVQLAQKAARMGVKRFIFVSTTKAAADPIDDQVYDESWDAWPTDAYGYWKRKTEEQLLNMEIPHLVIVRPSLIYGAGAKGNLLKMIRAIDKGYFPPLPKLSSRRSMVFAGDVANALLHVAKDVSANRQTFIVSDDEFYAASDLYDAIREALGMPPAKWRVPLPLLYAAGFGGDVIQQFHFSSPINSQTISRLTESAMYSSDQLKKIGWEPSATFYRELPQMIAAYIEAR